MPVRALMLEFAAIVNVTDPLPLPDAGLTVIHDTLLVAVHPQPAGVVTPTEAVLAPSPTDSVIGEIANVQATPACVTVTVCPATLTVPVRELVLEFAAIVSVTDPFPLPDAGRPSAVSLPMPMRSVPRASDHAVDPPDDDTEESDDTQDDEGEDDPDAGAEGGAAAAGTYLALYDLDALTLALMTKVQQRPDVEYVQPNRLLRPAGAASR